MTRFNSIPAALRISLIYLVFAGLWIVFSDTLLAWLVGEEAARLSLLQTIKGWLFVLVTAAILYGLVRGAIAERIVLEDRLQSQQALYRATFEQAPLGNAQLSREGDFLQVNAQLCAMLGYTEQELLQMTLADIGHPEERFLVVRERERLLAGETDQYAGEHRYVCKDGTVVWAQLSVSPVYEAGEFQFFVLVAQDITGRKEQEAELLSSERAFRQYFNQALIGLAVSGPDRHWIEANDRLCEILGYSRDELLGKNWADMTHPDDLETNLALFEQAVRGELDHYTLDKRFIRKDGEVVYTRLATQMIRKPDGHLGRLLTLVEDVTERERALQGLLESEARFRQVVETMPVLVDAFDEHMNLVFWNERCEQVTGYTAAEVVGNPDAMKILYPDEDYRATMLAEWASFEEDFDDWTLRLTCKDGSERVIAWSNVSYRVPVPGWATWSIGVDVTEQYRMEAALRESEERYRTLVQSSPLPILVHRRGTIAYVNPAAIQVLAGEDERQFLGRSIYDFIDRTFHEIVQQRVASSYAAQSKLDPLEERFVRLDGEPIDVEVISRLIDYLGEPHSQVIFQDITDRKRSEAALRRYNDRLAALHDIDQAILAAESAEEIAENALRHLKELVHCQRVSLAMFDFEDQEVRVLAAFADDDTNLSTGTVLPLAYIPLTDSLWQGQPYIVEDITQAAVSTPITEQLWQEGIRSYANVPLLIQGKLVGVLNIGQRRAGPFLPEALDIAQEVCNQLALALNQANLTAQIRRHATELEQRVAERTKALTIANSRLQELDRLKSKFVSDVSHELRAPITNLGMYLHLVQRAAPEKREQYFSVLDTQVTRLKTLIEGILDLSRLDLGKNRVAFSSVDFNAVVQQTVVAYQPRADVAGLELVQELDEGSPLVWGELNQLAQVVANLVTNAINYTPAGRVTVRTGFDTRRGQVMLRVIDTGMGIQPNDLPHLFDRFYRGEQPKGSDIPGTGLGLGIVKEIVDLHKGSIMVDSRPGEGSTFTVWLPPATEQANGI